MCPKSAVNHIHARSPQRNERLTKSPKKKRKAPPASRNPKKKQKVEKRIKQEPQEAQQEPQANVIENPKETARSMLQMMQKE